VGRNNSINIAAIMAKHQDITLHMGFINTPYTRETIMRPVASSKKEEKRNRKRGFTRTMTAIKVAGILEGKYNIVETFSEIYGEEIQNLLHDQFRETAKQIIIERGGRTTASLKNLMKPATRQIELMFRSFLNNEEMNGMVEGVPTDAAKGGKLRGRGKITRKGLQRASFINTGIYRASFRAWVK
jgi:hypothetical protein